MMQALQFLTLCAAIHGQLQQQHPSVLIIGAGISGLEAARLLRQHGIKTVLLEARNRTGGRLWSIRSRSGPMLDLGASYIHGIAGSIPAGLLSNPVWDLVQEAKILTHRTKKRYFLGSYPINHTMSMARHWYDEYMIFLREETRLPSANQSLEYYARLFAGHKNLTDEQQYMLFNQLYFMITDVEGADLNDIGAKGYLDLISIHHGEWRIFDETGYMALTDYLARDLPDIRLEQIVTKINYTDDFVQVSTNDGHVYRAEYVLITVPLGVLKSKQIDFYPPLPQWKLDAIDRVGFGLYEKVFLLWNRAWWNVSDFYVLRTSSKSTEFRYQINAHIWNNKSVLECIFSSKAASQFKAKRSSTEIIEEIRDTLQKAFPDIVIPSPDESYITNWNEDPFSRGSYSYFSIKQKYDDPLSLAEPIGKRLLFAGEATSTDTYGYTHGALLTGRREVSRLLFVYDLLPNSNSTTSQSSDVTIVVSSIFLQLFSVFILNLDRM